jgi:hypothetical protein
MRRLFLATFLFVVLWVAPASATHGYDFDCSNFSSQAAAQYHMNAHPGDPDGLDGYDRDGRACESNPCPCYYGSGTQPAPQPQPTPQPTPSPAPQPVQPVASPPSCNPETPASVTLLGVPSRVVIGPSYRFGLDDNLDSGSFVVDDLVHIEMHDGNGVFFEDDTRQRGEELFFFYLELGDPRTIVVSASYVEQAPDGTRCERHIAKTVRGTRKLYFPPRCQDGSYRPRGVIVFCADAGMILSKIRWHGWNRSAATGRATAKANTCVPSCAEGRFESYRVALRASRVRRCRDTGRYQYTRLRITFVGSKWNPGPRRFTQRFDCS